MDTKQAIKILLDVAVYAQSKGILALEDAAVIKTVKDYLVEEFKLIEKPEEKKEDAEVVKE